MKLSKFYFKVNINLSEGKNGGQYSVRRKHKNSNLENLVNLHLSNSLVSLSSCSYGHRL